MKHIRKFIPRYGEAVSVALIILSLMIANFWQVISQYLVAPAGTVFIGISHYHEDYFYYLSQVTQGALGAWTVRNLYSADPIPAVPLWWPNILLGKLAAVTGLAPWTVYDAAVFVTSGISLIVLYAVARKLFPTNALKRVSAFAVATLTTCYYLIQKKPDGTLFINPYQFFYDYTESLNRLGGVFHLILQNILTVGIILGAAAIIRHVCLTPLSRRIFIRVVLATAMLAFLLMLINPIYIMVDAVAVSATALGYLLIKRPPIRRLADLGVAAAAVGLPLLIPYTLINRTFSIPFYEYFRWWESTIYPTNPIIFSYSMGPVIIFALLGLVAYFRRATPLRVLGAVWFATPILIYFSPLPPMMQFPHFRLPQPPAYIFLGAAAVEGMLAPGWLLTRITRKNLMLPVFFLILTPYLAFQLPMIRKEIRSRTDGAVLTAWLNHPDADLYQALLYLRGQPHDRIAIGVNNTELLIPVVSGLTVYEGHKTLTYHYADKVAKNAAFFFGGMTAEEARTFLTDNNIGYIVWKTTDGDEATFRSRYPFLKVLYQNPSATVFTPVL